MAKILILFSHPSFEKSKANQILVDQIPSSPYITLHDLYEEYPDFQIDVRREQQLLLDHDIILPQHPFHWYSSPPLFKHWIDSVLEQGWAYGSGGDKLRGKKWIQVITTGGGKTAYSREGFHKYSIEEFLLPFTRTAELCGMEYLSPFLLQGTFHLTERDLIEEGKRYNRFLTDLIGGK
ncbi:NAD(P)H-dependent oxidoreductase [Leptospira idonii]|uniref:Sodium:proton antiporter n=1 Tax=Leptospira idonii TaxID=1193500 RepID=A0A4R9LXL3_9LEPT|nr:NAD(P)H-dependent oxidoreductase [Leptospira idonii]TGN18155.1 sodium:proton antiporter [Leptospira idonii]